MIFRKQYLLFLFVIQISNLAMGASYRVFKENSEERASLVNSKQIEFFYEKPAWNQNITEIESGDIYIRDKATKQFYKFTLVETEPNSSVFSLLLESGSLNTLSIQAEVYTIPKEMISQKDWLPTATQLVDNKTIRRKPFLLRVLKSKQSQIVDIFDSKSLALVNYEKYKKLIGLSAKGEVKQSDSIVEINKEQKPVKKKIIDTSTLQSMFLANEAGQANQNAKNIEHRAILKNVETKRRNSIVAQGKSWSPLEKSKNETEAKNKIGIAVDFTKKKNFEAAQSSFLDASNLFPSSEALYQKYGISLFKNDKFNQSIVVLDLANTEKKRLAEKDFFLGMNYFQLKDWENAEKHFLSAKNANDGKYSATAAFYLGNTQINLSKFEESKVSFQYVLDHSKSPEMDRRAEQYIEYAIKQQRIAEKRSHRWFVDGALGMIYDSNVTLALDSQANEATDQKGLRFLTANTVKYRALYQEKHELALALDTTLLQTQKTDFGSSQTLRSADPWVFGFGVPWTYKGTLGGKGFSFVLAPKYETTLMDLDGEGKSSIINSLVTDMSNTIVMSNKWVAKANFQIRKDTADINGSDGASAIKFVSDFSGLIILDRDSERYLIPTIGYTINNAKSSTFAYNRLDFSIAMTNSIFESFIWTNKLGFYLSNYERLRTDKNYSITSGIGCALSSTWNMGLNLNYQRNDSNTNPYDKFQVISTFAYSF